MPIRITGLNSGLDTEALVSELVSAYRKKSEKYTKAQTKLSWKQEKWKDLNKKVKSFYNSISSLRFSTAYNLKSATVSDASKATIKATSSSINGMYSLKIEKTAKSGYLTGGQLASGTTAGSKLSDLGYTGGNGTISVNADGKTTDIAVSGSTTIQEFVDSLNKAGVKANFDATNRRIFVASSTTGSKADFSLTGTAGDGISALSKLGLSVKSSADTANQKMWAAYALNSSGGQYITYDASGNMQFNGTYDATRTQNNIQNILSQMPQKSAEITNKKAQIAYANAYKAVQDVDNNGLLNGTEQKELKDLLFADLENTMVDSSGNLYEKQSDGTYTNKTTGATGIAESAIAGAKSGADRLKELEEKVGFTETKDGITTVDSAKVNAYRNNMKAIAAYEGDGNVNLTEKQAVQDAYSTGGAAAVDSLVGTLQADVDSAQKFLTDNKLLDNASFTATDVTDKITNAAGVLNGTINPQYNTDATRVNGEDAVIYVNGAKYVSESNDIAVNGMTISALGETGSQEITFTVNNNVQGLYDKIKGVLKEYNELVNEMTKLYNADTAKGYEPLTAEEREALSDSEIEDWEKKIKDSLLRRDDTLESLINSMTSSMMKTYSANGKTYSFSSFGIHTLGVLYADDNEQNALHIDGDSENDLVSGNADKLMKALTEDPDSVVGFMQEWADSLYTSINKKMQSSTLSSFNVVYNDKEMAKEYSDYTTTISKWEKKLQDIEDSYYKKFAAMESALAQLQAQQSNMASMLGM